MEKSHYEWQGRVLSDNNYMIVDAMNNTSLCWTEEEARKEMAKMPKYNHAKLYKKIDLANDSTEYENVATLRGLEQVEMISDYTMAVQRMHTPAHGLFHRTLFGRIA